MSWLAVAWAETVPVADVYERCILTLMAHRANPDGTETFLGVSKMAEFACCDDKTIERRLLALRKRGVIALGNQKSPGVMRIPKNRRPKVYDLLVPYRWYSADQLETEVNRDRERRGLAPLDPADRPPIVPPGRSRKARSDAGVPRPDRRKKTPSSKADSGDLQLDLGGLLDPPEYEDSRDHGGSTSPPSGGTSSPLLGGLVDPQYSPYAGSENSPSGQSSLPAGPDGPTEGPSERKDQKDSSEVTDQLELVGNQQTARANLASPRKSWQILDKARQRAGRQACLMFVTSEHPEQVDLLDLQLVIAAEQPDLTHEQVIGRASALLAWETKAAREARDLTAGEGEFG